jgi:hypothetical protein
LSARLRHAKEVETFQTVSTFSCMTKNLVSRLSLTVQNLPENLDLPMRMRYVISKRRKLTTCAALSMLRGKIEKRSCD